MMQPKKEKKPLITLIFLSCLFAGLILATGSLLLFEKIVLNWKIPVVIYLLTGVLLTPFTAKSLKRYGQLHGYFLIVLFNIISFGGMLVGLLIVLNIYFTNDEAHTYKAPIIDRGYEKSKGNIRNAYADVQINDFIKRISFPRDFDLEPFNYLKIHTHTGLLGIQVIFKIEPGKN